MIVVILQIVGVVWLPSTLSLLLCLWIIKDEPMF